MAATKAQKAEGRCYEMQGTCSSASDSSFVEGSAASTTAPKTTAASIVTRSVASVSAAGDAKQVRRRSRSHFAKNADSDVPALPPASAGGCLPKGLNWRMPSCEMADDAMVRILPARVRRRWPPWFGLVAVILCLVWMACGILGAAFMRDHLIQQQNDDVLGSVRGACGSIRSEIDGVLSHARSMLDAVAMSRIPYPNVTDEGLKKVASMWPNGVAWSRKRPAGVAWLIWLSRVPAANKSAWETANNATITEISGSTPALSPVAPRIEYFPVQSLFALGSNLTADPRMIGLDFGQWQLFPMRAAAILGKEGSSYPTAYTPTNILNSSTNALAGMYLPVYQGGDVPATPSERLAKFVGIAYGYINCTETIAALASSTRDDLDAARRGVHVIIADDTASPFTGGVPSFFVFARLAATGSPLSTIAKVRTRADVDALSPRGLNVMLDVRAGVQSWVISCVPSREYVDGFADGTPDVAAAGMVVLGLLMCILTLLVAKNRHVVLQRHRAIMTARDAAVLGERLANDMIGYVNHEIRNPLNGILGLLDLSAASVQQAAILNASLADSGAHDGHEQQARDSCHVRETANSVHMHLRTLLEDIATSRNCCQLISHIVNDVLDIRKIEEGRLILSLASLDARSVIHDAVRIIRPKLEEKPHLQLTVDCVNDLEIVSDRHRVQQLLLNFISNAVKFTDVGSICVRITIDNTAQSLDGHVLHGGGAIRFEVSDTGRGIPKERHACIFKPYVQVEPTDGTRYTGTGLGLFLCQRLVHLMGGTIGFDSEYGVGSTFWFSLPKNSPRASMSDDGGDCGTNQGAVGRVDVSKSRFVGVNKEDLGGGVASESIVVELDGMELVGGIATGDQSAVAAQCHTMSRAPEHASPAAGVSAWVRVHADTDKSLTSVASTVTSASPGTAEATPPKLPRLRLLVVDDVMVNRMVLRRQLESIGHDVTMCEDGKKAVEIARNRRFDGIFMDVQMPVMGGCDATTHIRASFPSAASAGEHETHSDVTVFGVTADITEGDVAQCTQSGMDAVLPKPVTLEMIVAALSRHFDATVQTLSRVCRKKQDD